ncbi:conserved Plasmodium protein, unknown function [Plasmodium gallinaceum]|uniref:Uncharacterized protein n=1 Tax=Plasmodium gallinaceum TaxID=5849 RepID=A0A1J1GKV7_PLAGA|nr:conserved Plasmodium protein, unknown function [Plasmodium gallinaceum]CRG93009.1 conserved Plasmodium protein, unknown function [Plasmodium gallinaceum]
MKKKKNIPKNIPYKNYVSKKKINKNRKSYVTSKNKTKLNKNKNKNNCPSDSIKNRDNYSESKENERDDNDLFTLSSYKSDESLYESCSDAHEDSNCNLVKNKVKNKQKYKGSKTKNHENCIDSRIKKLLNEKIDYHNIDLFKYLNYLNDENENNDLLNFIISEFLKKGNSEKQEKETYKKDKFNKNDNEEKSTINIKENIEIEYILNYEGNNFRNIFFLENIQIDFNKKKINVFPFKSESIVENIKKKVQNRSSFRNQKNLENFEKSTENKDILKICLEKKNFNNEDHIYINDIYISLNPHVTEFLYFILICNYLYNDREDNEKDKVDITINMKEIMEKLDEELTKDLTQENVFLSLCSSIIYLDFSSSINVVNFLSYFLNAKRRNENFCETRENTHEGNNYVRKKDKNNGVQKNEKNNKLNKITDASQEDNEKKKYVYELMNDIILKCSKVFNGSLLSISVCSYLNNFMYFNSTKKSKNFIFIYFISEFLSKPIFIDIIENNAVCKKLSWIKFDDISYKNENEYIYLLLCLIGNKIKIYGISKYNFFVNFFLSIKYENFNIEYIEKNFLKKKMKKLFTYKSNDVLSDFSYNVCIKNNKRFLRLAICYNNFKIKIVTISLNEINKNKINNIIDKLKTINISFQGCSNDLDFIFKNNKNIMQEKCQINEDNIGNMNNERNISEEKKEDKKDFFEKYEINVYEDLIFLQHGILSLCSFYPCVNSHLLCICSKEGNIVIIDIRNNNELFFFKRKTETVSHLNWYNNSCILFGQDKGCILHLFEKNYILNIDKTNNNLIDILCLNSFITNNIFMFIFDDGTIINGKLKKSKSKVKYNEFFIWKTKDFELNPHILLKISCMKNEEVHSVSLILLYEYLQGLQNIFNNGIKIIKSKKYESKINKKTIALTPKSISFANFDKNYIIAYGSACGLIHIFSRSKNM